MKNAVAMLQRGLSRLWSRALVKKLDSTKACQTVDAGLLAGEARHGLEYLEPYGFTSAVTARTAW